MARPVTTVLPTSETNLGFIDIDMLDDELANLEAKAHPDAPSHLKRQHSEASTEAMDEDDHDNVWGNEDFQLDSDSDSDDSDEEQDASHASSVFNNEALSKIRECISNVIVPTWITRPP